MATVAWIGGTNNSWSTAANWSTGSVPVNGDTVILDGRGGSSSSNAITSGLAQSAVTLAKLLHYKSAPPVGTLTTALAISATVAHIGLPPSDGSSPGGQLINIDTGTNVCTMHVYDSPAQGSGGLAPVLIAGNHASNVLNLYGGVTAAGMVTVGATCTYATINVVKGTFTSGTGVDFTTLTQNSGRVTLGKGAASGTFVLNGGDATVNGTTKIGTVTLNAGAMHYAARTSVSGSDIDTANMAGGELDFSGNAAAASIATMAVTKGGTIRLANATQLTTTTTTFDASEDINLRMVVAK